MSDRSAAARESHRRTMPNTTSRLSYISMPATPWLSDFGSARIAAVTARGVGARFASPQARGDVGCGPRSARGDRPRRGERPRSAIPHVHRRTQQLFEVCCLTPKLDDESTGRRSAKLSTARSLWKRVSLRGSVSHTCGQQLRRWSISSAALRPRKPPGMCLRSYGRS